MGYEVNRTSFLGQGLNPSAVGATDSSIAVQQSTQSSKSEFHPHPETLSKSARHQQIDHHMNLLHGIRKGKQAVSASGIAPTHVSNMAVMAKTYDVFLLVRPVNSLSTSLIEEGSAIGKALDVKAKTSDWGAWAGFIPNLQLFSKKYAQHSDKSNLLPFFTSPKTINNVSYLPKPLSLTQNRLMFLLQQDLIQIDSDSQDDGISLFTVKSPKGASENPNDLFSFRLRQNDLNGYTVEFKIQNQAQANWLPFEVIAEAEGDNPSVERATYLTADYDVYGVFPNFQQLAAQKENQTEIESFKESVSLYQENKGTEHGRAAARGLIRNTLNAARQVFLDQKNRAIVDPILGRITQFEKTFLSNLDAKFAKIAQFQNIGRQRDEILPDLRSLPMDNYLILYMPIGQDVEIFRVVSGYRDLSALFTDADD